MVAQNRGLVHPRVSIARRTLVLCAETSTRNGRRAALATAERAIKLVQTANKERLEVCERGVSDGYALQPLGDFDEIERLLRYESMVEKELKRACERLEHLQRRRLSHPSALHFSH